MSTTQHTLDIDCELTHYVETALWSSLHYESEQDDNPVAMDVVADASDIAPEALESMRADLEAFIDGASDDALTFWEAELGAGQVGHDFWLTRNGHGAGFWDRFSRGIGCAHGLHLTADAKAFGSSDLYIGDDGLVYVA